MQIKTSMNFSKRTRQIMIMVMIVAGFIMGGVMTAMAAPPAQTGTVTVTVADTTAAAQSGLPVYVFSGTTYTGQNGTTDGLGQVSFTLADGNYNFRADLNGTQFFSGGASGLNTCTIPTCTADSVTVTNPVVVTVENTDTIAQAGLNVYAFSGTTYTGKSGVTDGSGQVSFTLVPGDYNFRADLNGTQFFSGGAGGLNTCNIPGTGLNCVADSVTVTIPVVVTVADTGGAPQAGVSVYAFNGTTYSGKNGVTDGAGQVSLTLLPGNYNFRADYNGTQFFSGGASGVNTCLVPGCTTDSVTVTSAAIVTVANTAGAPQEGLSVYAFNGATYTGKNGVTDVNGQVSFTLVPGDYNFRADFNGTQFFSGGASGVNTCTVPGCTADSVTVTLPVVVTVEDSIGYPREGLSVYAFSGTTYTGKSGITDVNGQVSFTLVPGDYNFRADADGSQYFSGGSSGVNTCTIPGCLTDSVTVPTTAVTLPASTCTVTGLNSRTCDLWATTGTLFLPDGSSVPIWGYADSAAGAAQLPGPMIIVNEGETITINLTNTLGEATSLYFPGVAMQPDLVGAAPSGGTTSYTFVASDPGTYRYEAGLLPNAQHQVAMGMFGALIVRPVDGLSTPILNQAYADPATTFFDEALVVLSEIDPALNNSANPAAFDMRSYKPRYWLINGQAYPNTQLIPTAAGNKVLLRYINTGFQHHSMSLMGLDQMLLAEDGNPLPYQRSVVAESIMIGQTRDMIVNVPATTPDGSRLALYDANMLLHNNNAAGFGGMMTFLTTAAGPAGPDVMGPAANAVAVTPSPTDGTVNVSLTATVSDVATGNANIQAAEYYIDDTNGTPAAMTAADAAFDSPAEAVEAAISAAAVAALSPGDHTIYVRGQDAAGNWGSFNLVILRLELPGSGPTTKSLTLTPNPSAGDVIVALSGTADDRASGNSNIVDAEFFIGAPGADGSGTHMAVNFASPIASIDYGLTATELSGYGEGLHTVYVHSRDTFAWGPMATIDLAIDLSGPNTSNVIIAPNPNNGTLPINPSMFAARLDATISDPVNSQAQSDIYRAEFFINAACDDGTGIPMYAEDGLFNSPTEEAYALISLVNINTLGPGSHDILVHGRDNSGNWGPCTSTVLVIEQGAPTVSGTTAAPNPTNGATAVALTAVANDAGSAVTQAEWFVNTDPGPGNGMAMTISGANPWDLTANIDITGWADGSYTLYARARDTAGNWSLTDSTVLVVETPPPTFPGLTFSTQGNTAVPTIGGAADDADIYDWNGTAFSRLVEAIGIGMPGGANVDGLVMVSPTEFYISLAGNWNIPGPDTAQDEDVIYYNNGTWSVYFDGTAQGLTAAGQDLNAIDIVGGILYFSTVGNVNPSGVGGAADDADIYSWDGASFTRVWDASANGLPAGANVDGLKFVDATHFYLSFNGVNTNVPGLGNVQDEDVVYNNNGVWSVYFDGTAQGLTAAGQDLDAIDIP